MTEITSNKNKNKFDFVKPAKVEFTSGFSLEEQKKNIEQHFNENKKTSKTNSFVIIITLVSLALVGLCGYAIWQLIETNNKVEQVAAQKKLEVDKSIIVSGESFSLVIAANPPVKFSKVNEESKMGVFDDKKSTLTKYFYSLEAEDIEKIAGIEVNNVEYDNRLSQESFTNKFKEYLGSEYIMSSEKTFLPRAFVTNKIVPKSNPDNIAFYPVVSSNNYYIIKVTNQLRSDSTQADTANFVDELINHIYLN